MRRRTLWIIAAVLSLTSVPLLGVAFLWAAFFSVGTRGGTTSGMIRYNLSDPLTATIGYGPLALSLLPLVAAAVLAVVALRRKAQ